MQQKVLLLLRLSYLDWVGLDLTIINRIIIKKINYILVQDVAVEASDGNFLLCFLEVSRLSFFLEVLLNSIINDDLFDLMNWMMVIVH